MGKSDFKPGLESLRGLAALAVAVAHGSCTFPTDSSTAETIYSWIARPFSPSSAVVIFFVLSGYVLGCSFESNSDYLNFVVRRFFRIVPAFAFSVLFAFTVLTLFRIAEPSAATSFFRSQFWPALTWSDLWNNFTFSQTRVNGPTWSIWPELVGSAILPVLILVHSIVGRRHRWLAFASISIVLTFTPLRMLLYFYAGYFLVSHLAKWLESRSLERTLAMIAGILLLVWFGIDPVNFKARTIIPSGVGAILLIAAISSTRYQFLESAPLRFMGKISYSFYLLHFPIFYLCAIIAISLPQIIPTGSAGNFVIMFVSILLAIGASVLSYRFIETPMVVFGRIMLNLKLPAGYTAG